jgi:hypothetical protein
VDEYFYFNQENLPEYQREYCPSPCVRYICPPCAPSKLTEGAEKVLAKLFCCDLTVSYVEIFHNGPPTESLAILQLKEEEEQFKLEYLDPLRLVKRIEYYARGFYNDGLVSDKMNINQLNIARKIQDILCSIQETTEPWLLPLHAKHFECLGEQARNIYNIYLDSLGYQTEGIEPCLLDENIYIWILDNMYPMTEFEVYLQKMTMMKTVYTFTSDTTTKNIYEVYMNCATRQPNSGITFEKFYEVFLASSKEVGNGKSTWSMSLFIFALNSSISHLYTGYFKQVEECMNKHFGIPFICWDKDLEQKHYDLRWLEDLIFSTEELYYPHHIWSKNPVLFFKETDWWNTLSDSLEHIKTKEQKLELLKLEFEGVQENIQDKNENEPVIEKEARVETNMPDRTVKLVEIFPDNTCPTGFAEYQNGYKQCYEVKIKKMEQKLTQLKIETNIDKQSRVDFKRIFNERSKLSEKEIQRIFQKWTKICETEKPFLFPALIFIIFDCFLEIHGYKSPKSNKTSEKCCFVNPWRIPNISSVAAQFGIGIIQEEKEKIACKNAYIYFKQNYEKKFLSFLHVITNIPL